jgi:hypothetical protein
MPVNPPACSVRNMSSLPMPSSVGRATTEASNSSHSVEPARRSRSQRLRTLQRPIQKSKSRTVEQTCTVSLIAASQSLPFLTLHAK